MKRIFWSDKGGVVRPYSYILPVLCFLLLGLPKLGRAERGPPDEVTHCLRTGFNGKTAPQSLPQEFSKTAADIAEKMQGCKNSGCISRALAGVKSQTRQALHSTCIGRNKAAMDALMIRLAVNEASWTTTWLLPAIKNKDYDLKKFPIEYVVANTVLLPIMVNISCVNTFEKGIKGAPPVGWKQANWNYIKIAMISNLKVLPAGVASVITANVILDTFLRKKPEEPSHYFAKLVLLSAEQMTVGNFLNVKYFDPFLKVELPSLGKLLSETILKGVKNPKPVITAVGLSGAYAAKTVDFSVLSAFMNLTQIPTENLLRMSWEDVEKAMNLF